MLAWKPRRRLAGVALVALSVAALVGAIAAFGYYSLDWGCPSNAELKRPLATREVVDAFAEGGLHLARS